MNYPEVDVKRLKFLQIILKNQTTARLTPDGVEFKQGNQTLELFRQNGVATGRSLLG
jgi:hypothetical protein